VKEDKLKELEEKTFTIYSIVRRARLSIEIVDTIQNYGPEYDYHFFIRNNSFLGYSHHTHWRIAVIELAKLYGTNPKTHKYTLLNFLSMFKRDEHFGDAKVENDKLDEWERSIALESKTIKMIMDLRDKEYAHTDNTRSLGEELKNYNLITIGESIVEYIDLKFFNENLGKNIKFWDTPISGLNQILALLRQDFDSRLVDGKPDIKIIK
jgi:hypothetical protein